jgi:hypothetical protein
MDTMWNFRSADKAQNSKQAQDLYCELAESRVWKNLRDKVFPEDLQWEIFVDVPRRCVKVYHILHTRPFLWVFIKYPTIATSQLIGDIVRVCDTNPFLPNLH